MGMKYFSTNLYEYKYFQNFLYGYEIISCKFGQEFSDHAQFLDLIDFRKKSLKKN